MHQVTSKIKQWRKKHSHGMQGRIPKPLFPYMRFVQQTRSKIQEKIPNLNAVQIAKKCGELWRSMDESQKSVYQREFQQEKERYKSHGGSFGSGGSGYRHRRGNQSNNYSPNKHFKRRAIVGRKNSPGSSSASSSDSELVFHGKGFTLRRGGKEGPTSEVVEIDNSPRGRDQHLGNMDSFREGEVWGGEKRATYDGSRGGEIREQFTSDMYGETEYHETSAMGDNEFGSASFSYSQLQMLAQDTDPFSTNNKIANLAHNITNIDTNSQ